MSSATTRLESDSLGPLDVPRDAYYGVHTARAMANFPISGVPIGHFPELIRALALVKKAAVRANAALGEIGPNKARAIELACDEIAEGKLLDQFPVDVFQGGAGTSTNMNVNEVIANRALEHLGFERGRYDVLHPNNHVNLSQSTNDVYPTALRLSVLFAHEELRTRIENLAAEFERKAVEFDDVIKLGRTQLQDAVPMTLGQEFRAFAATLREDVARLGEIAGFLKEVNLGGTAIGTGINTDPAYREKAVAELAALSGIALTPASDLIEACWDTGAFVLFSGMLKRTATKLSKISNDLRLLSSGPRGGLNEIGLPPMQAGSSIMPGKVNPVIPELVNQVAFQVIGADLTITLAAEAGQLQLNAMEPVICYNILQSLRLMANAVEVLRTRCVAGILANREAARRHLEASTAVATALTPMIGYDRAAEIAKQVLATGRPVRELLQSADLPEDALRQVDDLVGMTRPWKMRGAKRDED